nr:MAG TPA: hypothetical protein [Caudoviricetes sp.]DAU94440.1 MAG TPA: hypothetical protein [Caudoviricetes sp.]
MLRIVLYECLNSQQCRLAVGVVICLLTLLLRAVVSAFTVPLDFPIN